MYDDDENDDDDVDPFAKYAREADSPQEMATMVRKYLLDPENYGLTEERVDKLIAKDEAQKIIQSAVSMRSFIYYAGDKIAELQES